LMVFPLRIPPVVVEDQEPSMYFTMHNNVEQNIQTVPPYKPERS